MFRSFKHIHKRSEYIDRRLIKCVAIIGMGTAGVSVLRQLVKHEEFSKLKVDVYDDEKYGTRRSVSK